MSACRRHYPGRIDGTDSLMTAPSTSAFPTLQLGRLLHYIFRGLLSVHSRYNLQTRQVALCDPLHRRLRRLCCLHRRSDCYRVERSSSRAGLSPAVDQHLFTAHCNGDVSTTIELNGDPKMMPKSVAIRNRVFYAARLGTAPFQLGSKPLSAWGAFPRAQQVVLQLL